MKPSVAVLILLLGLAACSEGADDDGAGRDTPVPSERGEPSPSALPDPAGLADTEVCGLVRDGIDAFNLGDLGGTVARFEEAVGPAEELARDRPGDDTETLLEAVRYYAALPAEDYVEANASSPEFARYKDFTLTECAYGGPPAEATDPAIPA